MAYGIEDIAKMQVTGPVQGGDMVMKPDQAPVGAAALLSKMAKKNTPGIFKLPMPDKQMPDFMKVAAEGVEQQTAKGDSINQMAGELLRQGINIQGMGMDEIIQIYEQTFGSPGDVDEFGVSQALENIRNDAKKIEAFAPEGEQLAYINKEEADILKLLGGSGEQEPITGVESFKRTREERKAANIAAETQRRAAAGDTSDYVQRQMANISDSGGRPGGAYETEQAGKAYETFQEALRQDQQSPKSDKEIADAWIKQSLGPTGRVEDVPGVETYSGFEDYTSGIGGETIVDQLAKTGKKGLNLLGGTTIGAMMKGTDTLAEVLRNLKIGNVKDFIKDEDSAAGWANLLNQFASSEDPEGAFQSWLEDEEGAWKDTMLGELKDDPGMEDKTKTTFDEVLEFMKTKHGGSEEWKKRFGDDKAEYWKDNTPQTGGQAENMASNLTMSDIEKARDSGALTAKEARRLSYDLQQARDVVSEQQDRGQDRHPGTRRPIEEQITEEEVATTTTDPRAGAFNVGGTMPYTHDVATGGVEMDVPLGRRFQIGKDKKYRGTTGGMDLNEAMQYATLGGYGQLEPFQEYLTRRRKHLGEEEPVYFDEEGNVIYSGVT
jgi:hypothetical protein